MEERKMQLHDQWTAELLEALDERDPTLARALATPPFPCLLKAAFAALQEFAVALAICIKENIQPNGYDPQPDKRCEDTN